MMKIKDITTAVELFETSAIMHTEATEIGDYKTGNKCYNKIIKVAEYLKDKDAINALYSLLFHTSLGVRSWAAAYLLPVYEKEAIRTLQEIAKSKGIQSLIAETLLDKWRKGNLKL